MKRGIFLSLIVICCSASIAFAQGQPATKPTMPTTGPRADLLKWIADAEDKIIQLADAMPAEKFAWRPAPGVRSVSEVYMHIAQVNFYMPSIAGIARPADVPREIEKVTEPAKVKELLKRSFEHVRQLFAAISDADLDKKVKVFGSDDTIRGGILLLATHAHEHLGQSIAYTRMNGIVPPWSK